MQPALGTLNARCREGKEGGVCLSKLICVKHSYLPPSSVTSLLIVTLSALGQGEGRTCSVVCEENHPDGRMGPKCGVEYMHEMSTYLTFVLYRTYPDQLLVIHMCEHP